MSVPASRGCVITPRRPAPHADRSETERLRLPLATSPRELSPRGHARPALAATPFAKRQRFRRHHRSLGAHVDRHQHASRPPETRCSASAPPTGSSTSGPGLRVDNGVTATRARRHRPSRATDVRHRSSAALSNATRQVHGSLVANGTAAQPGDVHLLARRHGRRRHQRRRLGILPGCRRLVRHRRRVGWVGVAGSLGAAVRRDRDCS